MRTQLKTRNLNIGKPINKNNSVIWQVLSYHGIGHLWNEGDVTFLEMGADAMVFSQKSIVLVLETDCKQVFPNEIIFSYKKTKSSNYPFNNADVFELYSQNTLCGVLTPNSLVLNFEPLGFELYFKGDLVNH